MLLVSVTTIAEGKREVWEYWGGSCLCAYTAERRETSSRQGKATHSPRAGAEQPSAALRQVAGVLRGNERRGDTNEIKQATERKHRLPLSHHFFSYQLARGNQWGLKGCAWTRRRSSATPPQQSPVLEQSRDDG